MKDTKLSIFRSLFKSKDVPYIVRLETIVERIKNGSSKETVEKIRNEKDKEKRSKLKCQLPSIVFAGEFTERNSKALVKHSGLMVLDFDEYPDKQTMLNELEALKQNKHFVLLFISPSGNGIKGVIKVSDELTKETHPKVYKQFQKEHQLKYLDEVTNNVDRVCFESFDENIFVNYDAEIFNPKIIDEGYTVYEREPILPISDEIEIIERIMKFKFNKSFVEGQRNAYLFDVASMFCEYGVKQSTCEGWLWNNVVHGDFKQHEFRTTIKSAYGSRQPGSKYFEDYSKVKTIRNELKTIPKKEVLEKHNITDKQAEEISKEDNDIQFWYIEKDKKGEEKVKLIPYDYKRFLEQKGFKKYYPNGTQKPTFVYVNSNIVVESSVEKIKDFVLQYLIEKSLFNVWSYVSSYQMIFGENYLLMLETIELQMLKDTIDTSYLTFNDCILKITKDEVRKLEYADVNAFVWYNNIIDREFKKSNDLENDYKRFINNISANKPEPMECTIGYLLCNYKNKMNNKAVILNDEVISENPEGGTGKGLFVQGLRQIRKVSILDGKSFDDRKSFPYQTVSTTTNILVFDDVQKSFNFENKFSLVTEGITLERKNKDAIKLTVEESPKILITTNYAIKGEGNSHNRRRHEIELAQYYNGELTPYDEFGRQLFDDWSEDEFNNFDNYMVYCIQQYLQHGLIQQDAVNITLRKFIAETSMEFYEWIEESDNFPRNEYNNKQQKYIEFVEDYQDFKKWLSRKRFAIWVQKYANFKGLTYNQGVSQGGRWFELQDDNKTEDNEIPF